MDNLSEDCGSRLEASYVKSTYDCIAEDFSSTRYKKWPKVNAFLQNLTPASLLLDVGCGNGKYLDNPTTHSIGCDLSLNLLKICKSRRFEVVLCDMTRLPFRSEVFDNVISIAALHHVISVRRRQKCLEDMVSLMSPGHSRLLVQVWSFEQDLAKDNPYLKRRIVQREQPRQDVQIGDNIKLPIHQNRTPFQDQDVLVPFHTKSRVQPTKNEEVSQSQEPATSDRQLRYYHVFKRNELDSLFDKMNNIRIDQSYYDRGNWCVIVEKVTGSSRALISNGGAKAQ